MITLGINAAYHDCSATLVHDGVVVAAAQEERFTRVKHGKRPVPFTTWQLPYYAIDHPSGYRATTLSRCPCTTALNSDATAAAKASSNQGFAPLTATTMPSRQTLPYSWLSLARSRCGLSARISCVDNPVRQLSRALPRA
jgi:hypothetical protein